MTQKRYTEIPKRQKCINKEEPYIGGAEDIIDDELNKPQSQVNDETNQRLSTLEESVGTGGSVDERIAEEGAKHYLKTETYSKTELNNMITTPNQEYVSVTATDQTTSVTDVLPATGAADTVYRVGNWDGSQYDTTCYTEYAWNGSAYVKLNTKEYGIDAKPTVNSDNLVKSGGVYDATTITTLYPNITADTIYGLEYKMYFGNVYVTPERNIRRITGFTVYAREYFFPTDTLKIVAYKIGDIVVLKELTVTGGINNFTFETPITCDEEHELAVYLPNKSGYSSFELGKYDGGTFYIGETNGLFLNSTWTSAFANSIVKLQFINTEDIKSINEKVEQSKAEINTKANINDVNEDLAELEQQIKKTDYYYGKVIGFIGDSYADAGTAALGIKSICKELYPNYFSKIHPDAIIDNKAISGAKISGTGSEYGGAIAQKANSFITNYPMQTSELPYPINTTDNVTTKSGYFIFKNFSKINGLLFNLDWNRYTSIGSYKNRGFVYAYIYSYNTTTHVFTELKNVSSFLGDSSNHQNGCMCLYFDDAVEALSGECIAVRFKQYVDLTTEGVFEWVDTYINLVEDTDYTYVLDDLNHSGEQEYQGVPLIQLMTYSSLECLVMQGGLNDYYTDTPIGQLTDNVNKGQNFDVTTFYGALEKMFCNVNYNLPFVRKGFIIMPQEMTDPSANEGWGKYVIAIKNTCKKWGIRYLDLNDMFATYCKNFELATNNGKSFNDYPLWGIEPDGRYNGHPEVLFARQMNRYIASFIESL